MFDYVVRNLHYALPCQWKAGSKALYRRVTRSGIFLAADELGMCSLLPTKKIERIVQLAGPKSVLDAGCGTGQTLLDFQARGIEVVGIEASPVAIKHSPRPELIRQHDLRKPLHLHRTFDLVWCFEVAEHIHPKYVDVFLRNLIRHSSLIVMSAAPPGQGGEGHFNEQPQRYWEKKLADLGYFLDGSRTMALQEIDEFYSANMMVFRKS